MSKPTGKPAGRPPKQASERAVLKQISFTPAAWNTIERVAEPGERSRLVVRSIEETVQPGDGALARALIFRDLDRLADEAGVHLESAAWQPARRGWSLSLKIHGNAATVRLGFEDQELAAYAQAGKSVRASIVAALAPGR